MKRNVMILMTGLLLLSGSVFAQGVAIDSAGNINAGAANGNGSLEVTGQGGSDGIVSTTTGIGTAVHGANLDAGGFAGYFEGNAEVTGNLNVQGNISGESDPQVGTLTNGKWCTTNGSQVNCTSDAPSGGSVDWSSITNRPAGLDNGDDVGLTSETDPTVGTLTNGKWCTTNGSQVICTSDAPGGGGGTGVCDQSCVDGFNTRIAALELLLEHFTKVNNDIYIDGANLHVRNDNATQTTDGAVNGLGNIIIGYNESRGASSDYRTGSHNLIVGKKHNYESFGGIVAGNENDITGEYASVIGGQYNVSSNNYSTVLGGQTNNATGAYSTVSGGHWNTAGDLTNNALGKYSTVNGGQSNTTRGEVASINGGVGNNADNTYSSITGGQNNTASGEGASINGGVGNNASGGASSISGGWSNKAVANYSSILGGQGNIAGDNAPSPNHAIGQVSSISGGKSNLAIGHWSTVGGGNGISATADYDWNAPHTHEP